MCCDENQQKNCPYSSYSLSFSCEGKREKCQIEIFRNRYLKHTSITKVNNNQIEIILPKT